MALVKTILDYLDGKIPELTDEEMKDLVNRWNS